MSGILEILLFWCYVDRATEL